MEKWTLWLMKTKKIQGTSCSSLKLYISIFDSWKLFDFVVRGFQVQLYWFTWIWGFEGRCECEIGGGGRRRRRHDVWDHSSHNDEEEHVFTPWRSQRREVFGNHMPRRDNDEEEHGIRPRQGQRRYAFENHTPITNKMWRKIIIPKFNGANDPKAYWSRTYPTKLNNLNVVLGNRSKVVFQTTNIIVQRF